LEYVWRTRTRPELERLEDRARRCRAAARDVRNLEAEYGHHVMLPSMRVSVLRSAEWADERARAVAMSRADVVATCNRRWRKVACGCSRFEFKVGCDQPQLCGRCRHRHSVKWWQRIARGMEAALLREREEWRNSYPRRGMLPGIYLITLTGPHSGDMNTDRERLGAALRKLLKHANKYAWWQTYALTWEATGGKGMGKTEAGDGHVHIHLAVISSWIPFRRREVNDEEQHERWDAESPNAGRRSRGRSFLRPSSRKAERGLHDVWQEAMPGAIQPDVSPPKQAKDSYGQSQSSGSYLAKYVTKGVDPETFTGAKAGELLVAFRNRRKVSTSAGFWRDVKPKCDCCGKDYRAVEAPCSLQDIAPGAVLRSHVARRMWLGIQESFPPWMRREHHPPPLVVEAKADKRNAPSKWAGVMN
jgi:hypothetical protein